MFALALILAAVSCDTATPAQSPTPLSPATATAGSSPVSTSAQPKATASATNAAASPIANPTVSATPTSAAISCSGTPTPSTTEGPFYTPGSPERANLLEAITVAGKGLTVSGYVLTTDCQPVPGAWLDFWQTDASGAYDNVGYTFRGHQFADETGRYELQTIVPGEYPGRTVHIHVKVQAPGGRVLTTQLYLPDVAANGRDGIFTPATLMQAQETSGGVVATFNFVLAN